jgi:hypothetical protein
MCPFLLQCPELKMKGIKKSLPNRKEEGRAASRNNLHESENLKITVMGLLFPF